MLKSLWQNPTLLHNESLGEIRDKRDTPKYNKGNYSKSIVNIKLNGEKFKTIPLKSRTRQGHIYSIYYMKFYQEQ